MDAIPFRFFHFRFARKLQRRLSHAPSPQKPGQRRVIFMGPVRKIPRSAFERRGGCERPLPKILDRAAMQMHRSV